MTNYLHIITERAGPLFTPYLFKIMLLDLLVGAVVLAGYYLQAKMDRNRQQGAEKPATKAPVSRSQLAKKS